MSPEDIHKQIQRLKNFQDQLENHDLRARAEEEFLARPEKDLVQDIDEIEHGDTDSAELPLKKLKLERLQQENEELKNDYAKKDDFYKTVKSITLYWLFFIALIVWLNSLNHEWFNIEANVLIALITSTTASVIGLFLIIGQYLFPNNKK